MISYFEELLERSLLGVASLLQDGSIVVSLSDFMAPSRRGGGTTLFACLVGIVCLAVVATFDFFFKCTFVMLVVLMEVDKLKGCLVDVFFGVTKLESAKD